MTQNPLFDEMQVHPKRSLGHASAAIEAVAAAAPEGAILLALIQHASYFPALSERYELLAAAGATVIVVCVGEHAPCKGVHEVRLNPTDPLASSWAVTLLTPNFGSYLTAEDLVTFDPLQPDIETGREFAASWGFDRSKAADVTEFYIDRLESEIDPDVLEQIRLRIKQSRTQELSAAEQALAVATSVILERVIRVEQTLASTLSALDVESQAASRDPLTQLLNRRGFDRWARIPEPAGVTLPSVGIILIDLDDFKAVNDQMGHLVGDRLLQQIAQSLRDGTRPRDIVCRWGGDEFLVACPGAELEELSEIGDRLIRAIPEISVDGMSVNASAGLHVGFLSAEGLIEADKALYFAKSLGGNTAIPASELEH